MVDRPVAFDIKAWSDYGLAVVGGAAALTGLLFVAVSVNSAWFSSSEAHRGRAGQALVLFVVPLVTGILLLIPGQSTTTLGIEIAVCGVLVGRVLLMLHSAELNHEPRVLVVIDRLSPRGAITAALIAGGASLVAGRFSGLYWLAGAHVGARSPASSTPGSSFSSQAPTGKSDRRQRIARMLRWDDAASVRRPLCWSIDPRGRLEVRGVAADCGALT